MFSYINPLPSLPQYAGPYKVGTAEFEIPVSEITSESNIPNPDITTIKFRLFYPTTSDASSKQSVYWLPEPQKRWTEAYASFMGTSSRWSSLASNLLSILTYAKLPVIKGAPLLAISPSQHPVCIFSHGLGGNFNTYSSIVGSLASCGVVCVASEHRDGSAPISFIKNADGEIERTISYQKHSHAPSSKVLNARNAQMRVRLWELDLTYSVVKAMNEGQQFTNYAEIGGKNTTTTSLNLEDRLNLQRGQVTWAGHSFGAATITQFLKSVFYHQYQPKPSNTFKDKHGGWDWTPLYTSVSNSSVASQITAESPVALLDLWTMPLRGEATKWLWERPMPCYTRPVSPEQPHAAQKPNTVAIVSAEFYKWTDLLNRTRALLSRDPVAADRALEIRKQQDASDLTNVNRMPSKQTAQPGNPIPELSKQGSIVSSTVPTIASAPSPISSAESSRPASPSHSQRSSEKPSPNSPGSLLRGQDAPATDLSSLSSSTEPRLYLIPQSAHLSQSDFGVLFPNLTRYAMKAIDPAKTIELNLRAILAVVKNSGLAVESFVKGEDRILDDMKAEERFVRVPLFDA